MFVTLNQFYVFIACVTFGALMCVLYSPLILIKKKYKNVAVALLVDIIYYFLLAVFFMGYSFCLSFPSLRAYMLFGVLLGNFLYIKSFHYMLAKVGKRLYNIFIRKFVLRKKLNDRGKN